MSDFQAVIVPEGFCFDALALIRACRLATWKFDHLLAAQTSFGPYVCRRVESPYADLSRGYDAYAASLNNSRTYLGEQQRKYRKLERQYGPVRFVPHVPDASILSTVIQWKVDQYLRTNQQNFFHYSWPRRLLETLLACEQPGLSVMQSVLYAGDHVAAISFGLRAGGTLHSWFPAYNLEMAQCSPGTLLFIELFKAAQALGIDRFDFGKGPETYKRKYMTGVTWLSEGAIDARRTAAVARHAWQWTRERIRSSPLYKPAQVPAHLLRRAVNWLELR